MNWSRQSRKEFKRAMFSILILPKKVIYFSHKIWPKKKKERDTAADEGKAQSYFISTSLHRFFNVVREGRLTMGFFLRISFFVLPSSLPFFPSLFTDERILWSARFFRFWDEPMRRKRSGSPWWAYLRWSSTQGISIACSLWLPCSCSASMRSMQFF